MSDRYYKEVQPWRFNRAIRVIVTTAAWGLLSVMAMFMLAVDVLIIAGRDDLITGARAPKTTTSVVSTPQQVNYATYAGAGGYVPVSTGRITRSAGANTLGDVMGDGTLRLCADCVTSTIATFSNDTVTIEGDLVVHGKIRHK